MKMKFLFYNSWNQGCNGYEKNPTTDSRIVNAIKKALRDTPGGGHFEMTVRKDDEEIEATQKRGG